VRRQVSFCFDDGFRASAARIRAIFEQRGLAACFCVLAAPEQAEDPFVRGAPVADWSYWRETMQAGHEVAPHGYAHEHLGKMPVPLACERVQRTLDTFHAELPGFAARSSLFHVPYLAAPPEIVEWIGKRTLGARLSLGTGGLNDLREWQPGRAVDCMTFRPPDADALLRERVAHFIDGQAGWLVLVLHGLDGEGWGTVRSETLGAVLDELAKAGVGIAPPNEILRAAATS
jgi:peptidoglycan/xylan/chitin deacetylase (PgdA/CDA1 family)